MNNKTSDEKVANIEELIQEYKTYNDLDGIQDLSIYINALENILAEREQKDKRIKEQEEEIEKKDKIIDLMAERINWLCKTNGILLDREHGVNFTEEDIKQYFERKVEDVKD